MKARKISFKASNYLHVSASISLLQAGLNMEEAEDVIKPKKDKYWIGIVIWHRT